MSTKRRLPLSRAVPTRLVNCEVDMMERVEVARWIRGMGAEYGEARSQGRKLIMLGIRNLAWLIYTLELTLVLDEEKKIGGRHRPCHLHCLVAKPRAGVFSAARAH